MLASASSLQPQGEPLGEPPVVDEDDRRAMLLDEPEQARIDRGPDRACRRLVARRHLDPVGQHGLGEGPDRSPARACPRARPRPRGRAPCGSLRRQAGSDGRPTRSDRSPRAALGRREPDALERLIGDSARRSSEIARCAPRFVPATACTSSTITVSMPRRISRPWEVRRRNSDSGVVIRMSGGVRSI